MPSYNKLAALKEIGAIEHRLSDPSLSPVLRRDIISRHVTNLICDLIHVGDASAKFGGILERMAARYATDSEILAGCALLRSIIQLTYGCVPAGTVIKAGGILGTKRKDGFETGVGKVCHFSPDTPVTVINH